MSNHEREKYDESVLAVYKTLGEPASLETSDFVNRIRTNLLVASSISLVIVFAGVGVDPGSSFLGIRLTGLDQDLINTLIFFWVAYLLFHFSWASLDQISHWRLRLTGTKVAFQTGAKLTSQHGDYPDDPRQSTLYCWWVDSSSRLKSISKITEEMKGLQDKLEKYIDEHDVQTSNIDSNLNAHMVALDNKVQEVKSQLESSQKTYSSPRIKASLERFDRWFKFSVSSQNLRWVILEFLFPIIYSAFALIMLLRGA